MISQLLFTRSKKTSEVTRRLWDDFASSFEHDFPSPKWWKLWWFWFLISTKHVEPWAFLLIQIFQEKVTFSITAGNCARNVWGFLRFVFVERLVTIAYLRGPKYFRGQKVWSHFPHKCQPIVAWYFWSSCEELHLWYYLKQNSWWSHTKKQSRLKRWEGCLHRDSGKPNWFV